MRADDDHYDDAYTITTTRTTAVKKGKGFSVSKTDIIHTAAVPRLTICH
jgi:hypothetical protein